MSKMCIRDRVHALLPMMALMAVALGQGQTMLMVSLSVTPVSYTHLDVYKRQGLIMALVFGVFAWRLYDLQIVNQQTYAAQAESKKQKILTLTGSRGKILDRNAVPLAYNQRSFEVQFYRDPSRSSQADRNAYTQSIMEVIEIVEKMCIRDSH